MRGRELSVVHAADRATDTSCGYERFWRKWRFSGAVPVEAVLSASRGGGLGFDGKSTTQLRLEAEVRDALRDVGSLASTDGVPESYFKLARAGLGRAPSLGLVATAVAYLERGLAGTWPTSKLRGGR